MPPRYSCLNCRLARTRFASNSPDSERTRRRSRSNQIGDSVWRCNSKRLAEHLLGHSSPQRAGPIRNKRTEDESEPAWCRAPPPFNRFNVGTASQFIHPISFDISILLDYISGMSRECVVDDKLRRRERLREEQEWCAPPLNANTRRDCRPQFELRRRRRMCATNLSEGSVQPISRRKESTRRVD